MSSYAALFLSARSASRSVKQGGSGQLNRCGVHPMTRGHPATCAVCCAVQSILTAYQSRQLQQYGSADAVFEADQEARRRMRAEASAETFRQALRRLLPWPCSSRHTIVTTVEGTAWHTASAALRTCAPWLLGVFMLGALLMWRGRRVR